MSSEPLIGKYTPLKVIVDLAADELNKSDGDTDQMWILGLRGLLKLNQQISAEPKTVRLPVNSNKTVSFPPDCLTWTKIGLLNSHGEVVTLKINNGLTTYRDLNPNRIEDLTPNVNDSIGSLAYAPFYLNYYYNNGYYNLFGVGGGLIQYGECKVDEANRVVVLPPNFQYQNIIFEYISNPERNQDYMVLSVLTEAIIAFIKWKMNVGSRADFYAEATEARRTLPGKKVTLQSINQFLREPVAQKLRS